MAQSLIFWIAVIAAILNCIVGALSASAVDKEIAGLAFGAHRVEHPF